MSKPKTFVFNDETIVNSYGFRVLNAGIECARFDINPAMLNDHNNSTETTLGNWKKRRVEGFQMMGEPNFDIELPLAKQVSGQVDREFIKACSMGLAISFDEGAWQKAPDGVWELVKCELMEVSICAVPSNASALALYNAATGDRIEKNDFKLSLKKLSANDLQKPNTPTMDKIILSTQALSVLVGLNIAVDNPTANDISGALVRLQADATAAINRATAAETKLTEQVKLQAELMVDGAITIGKLVAGERQEWLDFAIANPKLAAAQINKMAGKKSLSANNSGAADADEPKIKTKEDFLKAPLSEQLAFKADHPEAYNALYAKKK